jgi:hypothetical protein
MIAPVVLRLMGRNGLNPPAWVGLDNDTRMLPTKFSSMGG